MNLSCSARAQSSSVKCSMTPPGAEPALLTRMSMRPSALCACLMKFSASAGLVRSATKGWILRPVAFDISAAAASSGSLRRAQIATSTPSRASANVIALPMPSLAPVTIAFFPVMPRSMACSPWYEHHACCRRGERSGPATSVLQDPNLLDGYEPARHHAIKHRQKGIDFFLAVDDFDNHRQVLRQA